MPKIRMTLKRNLPQVMVATVDVDDKAAAFLLDPANHANAQFWAEGQAIASGGEWKAVPQINFAIESKIENVTPVTTAERFTHNTTEYSSSSQKVTGTYVDGVTRDEIEKVVKGSWGGRFDHFGDGTYVYIAYTD